MVERGLRLVDGGPRRASSAACACTGGLVLGLMLLATLLGADAGRREGDPRTDADDAVRLALERGAGDTAVRDRLIGLRGTLGARSLDGRARVAYAAAVAGVATTTRELDVAAFHAACAADLAPVTVPVVRSAVLVLVRAGDLDPALSLVGGMFAFDASAAARLLLEIEPGVPEPRVSEAIATAPEAWLAWSRTLLRAGRADEAAAALAVARARWPSDLDVLAEAATRAYTAGDVDALDRLLPSASPLPVDRRAGMLHLYRGVVASKRGAPERARVELDRALERDPQNTWLRILVGDALDALGDTDAACRLWSRVRFEAPRSAVSTRVAALRRLARADERRTRAGSALGLWREILVLAPGDTEAARRVAALTGAPP